MGAGSRVALTAFVLCTTAAPQIARSASLRAPTGMVAVLLAEGRIAFIDVSTGATLTEYPPRTARPGYRLTVERLARSLKRDEVVGILTEDTGSNVVALHAQTFVARQIGRLPVGQYAALAVGESTGRIFAFSSTGVTVYSVPGDGGAAEVVMRSELGRDVYAGAVSPDERRLYVSYHGRGTGVQWFNLVDREWRPGVHLVTHGNFALSRRKLLAATGDPAIAEFDLSGSPSGSVNTSLYNSHLMEFAVDEPRGMIYAVGSCSYTGGFSVNRWPSAGLPGRLIVPLGDFSVCGDRVSVSPTGRWLAVASREVGGPSPNPLLLLVIDASTGAVLQRVKTSSDVVDVLAVR